VFIGKCNRVALLQALALSAMAKYGGTINLNRAGGQCGDLPYALDDQVSFQLRDCADDRSRAPKRQPLLWGEMAENIHQRDYSILTMVRST
jgi:hypothetical protein